MFNSLWCFGCLFCFGIPDWPENGVANREWVIESIEWRLKKGPDACTDNTPAIDAWTLEWISNYEELRVNIETAEWPVFEAEQKLQGTLIQIIALEQLYGKEHNPKKCLKTLKKYAKKSDALWDENLKEVFEENAELFK
jgi:hypothetical protein